MPANARMSQNTSTPCPPFVRASLAELRTCEYECLQLMTSRVATSLRFNVHACRSPNRLSMPNKLHRVDLSVVSPSDCREALAACGNNCVIDNGVVCTNNGDKDACQGDSGGPLFLYPFGESGLPFQVSLRTP
eukprot:3337448-Pleurochrysis_carterae.AAC.5